MKRTLKEVKLKIESRWAAICALKDYLKEWDADLTEAQKASYKEDINIWSRELLNLYELKDKLEKEGV